MIILTTAMFQQPGLDNLALDNTKIDDLQAVIDNWEKYYIYQLLSNNTPAYAQGLADLFVAECSANDGVPTSARFVKIYNLFNEMAGAKMWSSKGMKQTFKSIILYHYITEGAAYSGTGGVTAGNSSASKTLDIANSYRFAELRFNDAILSIRAIQWWLKAGNANGGGSAEYPEYVYPYCGPEDGEVFAVKYQL